MDLQLGFIPEYYDLQQKVLVAQYSQTKNLQGKNGKSKDLRRKQALALV
jgi:hypothetical protein